MVHRCFFFNVGPAETCNRESEERSRSSLTIRYQHANTADVHEGGVEVCSRTVSLER